MLIKSFKAKQFAGIRNKSVDFGSGINVVLGNNETGKSTLINGIFHTLTEPQKILKSSKTGKEFIEECYPANGANVILAELSLEDNGLSYTIEREWNKNGKENKTRVVMPNDSIVTSEQAEAALNELLKCPVAVYDYLVFGRQKNEEQILGWCYNFFANKQEKGGKDGIEETRNTVSSAISAAGGVSLEKLLGTLDEKIKEKAERWDFDSNGPQDGKMNWTRGAGSIVRLFYKYKEALNKLQELKETDEQLRRSRSDLERYAEEKAELEKRLDELSQQRAAVQNAENLRKLRENADNARKDAVKAKDDMAAAEQALAAVNELTALNAEKEKRDLKENLSKQLNEISALEAEIGALVEQTKGLSELGSDCKTAQALCAAVDKNNARLNAVTLHAGIKMQSPHVVQIQTSDNTVREFTEGETDINGFFRIKIPNVGEITIAPQNVDVEGLLSENEENSRRLDEILKRYGTNNVATLKEMANDYAKNADRLNALRSKLDMYPKTAEQLREELGKIRTDDSIVVPADIEARTSEFLRRYAKTSLDVCKSRFETIIGAFKEKYGSPDEAQRIINENEAKISEYDKSQTGLSVTVDEFERETADLGSSIEALNAKRAETSRSIGTLEAEFRSISEAEEEVKSLKAEWELEKHKCECYKRIRSDLLRLADSKKENKFADFNKRFSEYLGIITDSAVTSNDEAGMEELMITSNSNSVDDLSLLSAGTKKTLTLAFRLAVLDFFFPDGGGIVVIDDGLLDMDAKRRANSAQLLRQFAQNNQVILMTCDENIADLVGGNRITIS